MVFSAEYLIYIAVAILILAIYFLFMLKIYIKLTTGWCRSQTCLLNKTALITGANAGIGYETALDLAKRGARVIIACRDEHKAIEARERIIRETDNENIVVKVVDLASFKSVRQLAQDIKENEKRLDILINNAGIITSEHGNTQTEDGLPIVLQTNYFSHFLLTNLLLDMLNKSGRGRVINVSSIIALAGNLNLDTLMDFSEDLNFYAKSKVCNIFFTIELSKKLKETCVTTYSLHPGLIKTKIFNNLSWYKRIFVYDLPSIMYKNVVEGAQTSIYLAVQKNIEVLSGKHFHDCKPVKRYRSVRDEDKSVKLWTMTENIVQLRPEEKISF